MVDSQAQRLAAVVFGATGFTGKYAVLEILKLAKEKNNLTWGIAGRNLSKLKNLLLEIGSKTGEDLEKVPIIVADVNDDAALCNMAKQAQVVINCAGPYRFYGEAVVKACIASGTHHVDVSGEPQYMEKMQLQYNKAAEEKGVYVISACGFDSIPCDLGCIYFTKKFTDLFGGDVNAVESYVTPETDENVTVKGGGLAHYGTWESAVYGLAHANELKPIRTKLFPSKLPVLKPKLKPRFPIHKSKYVKGWNIPFLGSDRSVVMRSQRHFFEHDKKRPVQIFTYCTLPSLLSVLGVFLIGFVFMVLCKFSFGRKLLLKFPRFFSFGMFSHEGPSEESLAASKFSMTFYCEGWSQKLSEPTDQHSSLPSKMLVGKVSGRDPGYGATCTALVLSGLTILGESNKMPGKGGVLPPGAAFANTSLVQQLMDHGYKFEVVTSGDIL